MSIYGLLVARTGLAGPKEAGSARRLLLHDHHVSKASGEGRNLTRHWITSFALVEHEAKMGQFAPECKSLLQLRFPPVAEPAKTSVQSARQGSLATATPPRGTAASVSA